MLCCIRNRCNLSEHAPKKTPSSGFLCTGRSGVTTRKWIWISYFLFLSSLWCLWSSVSASSFGFCVVYHRLETVKGGWAQREGERGGREETAEVECSVRFIVSVLHLNCLMLDFGYAPRKKAWFFKVIWCFSNTTTRGNQKSFQYLELNYQICNNYLLEMSEN